MSAIKIFVKLSWSLLCIGLVNCAENPDTVEFWEYPFYWGSSFAVAINDGQCFTFPDNWHNTISSVNPHNKCIEVFDGDNCRGNSSATKTAVGSLLFAFQLNNKIRSFKLCPKRLANKVAHESLTVTLHFWESEDFKDQALTTDIRRNECYNLPVAWRDRAASLDSNGYCVRSYKYLDCRGKYLQTSAKKINLGLYGYNYAIRSVKLCPTVSITTKMTTTRSPSISSSTSNPNSTQATSEPTNATTTQSASAKPTTIRIKYVQPVFPVQISTEAPSIFSSLNPTNFINYLYNLTDPGYYYLHNLTEPGYFWGYRLDFP